MSGTTYNINLFSEETGQKMMEALHSESEAVIKIADKMGALDLPKSWMEFVAQIRSGMIGRYCPVGSVIEVDKESGVSTTIHGNISAASVVEDTFIAAIGHAGTAAYEFIYDGSTWHHNGDEVELSNYGLSYTGTPAADDMIVVHVQGSKVEFVVVANDYDVPVNSEIKHTLSLWTKDLLLYGSIPFCQPQALRSVDSGEFPSGIAAGSKIYLTLDHGCYNGTTVEDGIYSGTLTKAVPAGGKIRHTTMGTWLSSGYGTSHITGGTFTTYDANGDVIESGIATTLENSAPAGGIDLGTATACDPTYRTTSNMNFTQRNAYGSNRWPHSVNKKWLNSDAAGAGSGQVASWWSPSDEFDMPVKSTLPGFLHGLDPAFREIIQPVRKRTAKCIADGYGYEDTIETIFEPSMTELGYGKNNNISETAVKADGTLATDAAWDLYVGATNADRIMLHNGTARYYWHRSPFPSYANVVRLSSPDGSLGSYYANHTYGVSGGLTVG